MLLPLPPTKRYCIGCDPGVRCGVAVFDRLTDQIILARTVSFWQFFREVLPGYPPDQADVIVEDARLNKPTFAKANDQGGNKREKISRNVGSVQAESRLIIEGLRLLGYNVLPIKPSGEKWDASTVERVTGYARKTSSHARDAIRFCYGVKFIRYEA
jgi:hypothetical protein